MDLHDENVKLLMHWDIRPGRDQEYFEFVVREWVPGVTKLGMQPTGAWYTVYSRGEASQIMTEALSEDYDTMRGVLDSPEWQALHEKLLEYVQNYTQKVVRVSGGFQL